MHARALSHAFIRKNPSVEHRKFAKKMPTQVIIAAMVPKQHLFESISQPYRTAANVASYRRRSNKLITNMAEVLNSCELICAVADVCEFHHVYLK